MAPSPAAINRQLADCRTEIARDKTEASRLTAEIEAARKQFDSYASPKQALEDSIVKLTAEKLATQQGDELKKTQQSLLQNRAKLSTKVEQIKTLDSQKSGLERDLASRYKFAPLVGGRAWGETVALRLEQLFLQHGPPLVLKRDNGPNLNHQAVDEVLARHLVIPLNSPPHYPPYNGGMECAVRELKTPLVEKILGSNPITESQVQVWEEMLAHELNHRSRGCLDGQVACEEFQDAKPAMKAYTLRRRRETFDWINELTMTLIQVWAVHTQRQADTVRRLAVETWLQRNGVITITQNKKVLPVFLEQSAHN